MADRIDSRDLLGELRDLLGDSSADYTDAPTDEDLAHLDEDDRLRVQDLRTVLLELPDPTVDSPRGNSWGCTMVPEDEFEDYARELAEEIGAYDPGLGWPHTCIDWKRAARDLRHDYTAVELDGTTYLCRV